jgi:hypothetical protein
MPIWLSPLLHGLQSAVIAGGVIALICTGKLDTATGVGILSGLGGAWAGVGGAVAVTAKSAAANSAQGGRGGSTTPPAPADVPPLPPPPPVGGAGT